MNLVAASPPGECERVSVGDRIRLANIDEIPEGTVRRCLIAGHPPFAVYNLGGTFFVTEDNCTHGMASLSEGMLEGDVIECPYHGGAFNVRTGEPVERPCVVPLKIYEAIIDDGAVYVKSVPRK
jgi:nitrite reductase/ring-hydroxylating ferredoxin subunit